MSDPLCWQLSSSSGREVSRWTVTEIDGTGSARTFCCEVSLEGRFYGDALDSNPTSTPASTSTSTSTSVEESRDFGLVVRGLLLRQDELSRLVDTLREWLDLTPVQQRQRPLALDCGMGALFDQSLRLTLGLRDDTLVLDRPVATLAYIVGRLRGELSYAVDPSCLQILVEGIEAALEVAG